MVLIILSGEKTVFIIDGPETNRQQIATELDGLYCEAL